MRPCKQNFFMSLFALMCFLSASTFAQNLPEYAQQVNFKAELGTTIPNELQFVDDHGAQVSLAECFAKNRPVILVPVYYACPRLCNLVLNSLIKTLKVISLQPGKDYSLVAYSIDPQEKPDLAAAKKNSYWGLFGGKEGMDAWHFLTGQEPPIAALSQAIGFRYSYDPASKQFAHAAGVLVLTPEGKISRAFYGAEFFPKDLQLGLVEASSKKIGSVTDQILLLCFQYDPSTGKYSLAILKAVRMGAVLVMLGLGSFIGIMLFQSRQKKGISKQE